MIDAKSVAELRAKTGAGMMDCKKALTETNGNMEAAIDYLRCREGKTFEERKYNLVLCWGDIEVDDENEIINISSKKCSVNDFVADVQTCCDKNLLVKDYDELRVFEIPRYYMQVRYGSMFSKSKHIRVYSYFADAILFKDGALWRDA